MGFFSRKALPTTSYGYVPPAGATARGWHCRTEGCFRGEHEPVRRWPKPCPDCGSMTDPVFDEPWAHDAEGAELRSILQADPDADGGFHQDRWVVWQFKDAVRRRDRAAVDAARRGARAHVQTRTAERPRLSPGDVYHHLVWTAVDAGDLDGAADDLVAWAGSADLRDVEEHNGNRTNARQIINCAMHFFDGGGGTHPRAAEVRAACLEVAGGAFPILLRDQQAAVTAWAGR